MNDMNAVQCARELPALNPLRGWSGAALTEAQFDELQKAMREAQEAGITLFPGV